MVAGSSRRGEPRFRVRGVPVLMYHGISASTTTPDKYWLTLGQFGEQLALLRDENWQTNSLAEFGIPAGARRVVLTFDDGNASDYECAFPALHANQQSATFFVNTATIGTAGFLDWSRVKQMLAAGMRFGSHGHRHVDLRRLGAKLLDELLRSRHEMEQRLGCAIECFSAPYSLIDRRVARIAHEAGFRYVCSSRNWLALADDFIIPRLVVLRDTQSDEYRRLIEGDRMLILRRLFRERALSLPKRLLLPLLPARYGGRAREEG